MKFLLLLLAISVTYTLSADIIVVDNTPGTGAPYTTLQSAINAASAGDTIMIQPSAISYGNVNVNKSLTLLGPGFYEQTGKNATVGTITLQTGSSNTTITGLSLGGIEGGLFHLVDSVTISRNYFFGSHFVRSTYGNNFGIVTHANDWVIEGNVMVESNACGGCILIDQRSAQFNTNWVIKNNLMITRGGSNNNTRLFSNLNVSTLVYYNIIIHRNPGYIFGGPVGSWGVASNDVVLQNNIFWVQNNTLGYLENCLNCQFVHNIAYSPSGFLTDTLPGNTNLNDVDPEFVKIPGPSDASFAFDNDYHCAPGSDGATGSSNQGMLGVYGGNINDFRFSNHGDPDGLPRIIDMILDNVVIQQGNDATIRVKATGGHH